MLFRLGRNSPIQVWHHQRRRQPGAGFSRTGMIYIQPNIDTERFISPRAERDRRMYFPGRWCEKRILFPVLRQLFIIPRHLSAENLTSLALSGAAL
jgi:hypothetical protein